MNLLENLAKNGSDSYTANDILVAAVIESLLQADFLPCFELDISAILRENVRFISAILLYFALSAISRYRVVYIRICIHICTYVYTYKELYLHICRYL
jgi:hypothetical protein